MAMLDSLLERSIRRKAQRAKMPATGRYWSDFLATTVERIGIAQPTATMSIWVRVGGGVGGGAAAVQMRSRGTALERQRSETLSKEKRRRAPGSGG